MKKIGKHYRGVFLLSLAFTALIAACPGEGKADEGQYVFRNDKVSLSTFYAEVAPSTYISYVNGSVRGWTNLSGGFILNNRFYISAFLLLSPTFSDFPAAGGFDTEMEKLYATFRHAGFKFGYMHRTDRMVFWRTGLAVGLAGGYKLTDHNSLIGSLFSDWTYKAKTFSLEPSIGVGFNMLNWWRLYVDLGYRLMGPGDSVIDVSNGNSITLMVSVGFGNFRYK